MHKHITTSLKASLLLTGLKSIRLPAMSSVIKKRGKKNSIFKKMKIET